MGRLLSLLGFFLTRPRLMGMKFFHEWHSYGTRAVIRKIRRHFFNFGYKRPLVESSNEAAVEEIKQFFSKPLISIVLPTYNVDPKWCIKAIKSVHDQFYTNWELCIVDDGSTNSSTLEFLKKIVHPKIHVFLSPTNKGISEATNQCLKMTKGEYVAFLDHDDELAPHALLEVVREINRHKESGPIDILYSDEDHILPSGQHFNPHFKSDFNPDLLLMHNYITHLVVYRRSFMHEVGLFRSEFDGAQDYDYILRATEKTSKIVHIPKVLYYWRMIEGSTALDIHSKPKARERTKALLEEALARRSIKGKVSELDLPCFFRVQREIIGNPLVSIIIPFRDESGLLKKCLEAILTRSTYKNYEIIGISNNSIDPQTHKMMEEYQKRFSFIHFFELNDPFNFSQLNNFAVEQAKGEHIILLNNDVEIISLDWIECMLEHSQRPEVGAVGAKLIYKNNTVQHAGIILGIKGVAGHSHKGYLRPERGYFNRLLSIQNVSAVTGACLMVKKSLYLKFSGLDEVHLKVAFNDVDFCLRLLESGLYNVYTPFAEAYHYESYSRGRDDRPENIQRYNREREYFQQKHQEILGLGDPFYNKNLTLDREDFSFR